MNSKFDTLLMVKVAQMYYQDGLKQDEIASQLQISRAMISMILSEAKETGIIEISVRNPLINNDELSEKLKVLFNLKDCIVIPTAIQDVDALRKFVAQRAVDMVNAEIKNLSVIGLTWGRTCYQFVSAYTLEKDVRDISVLSLIGGSDQMANYFQLNEMVRKLAKKLNGTPYFIHAPALVSSQEEKELYMNSASMQAMVEKWKKVDLIVAGIGTHPAIKDNERETYIGEDEANKQVEENEAVGDICARYFNIKGEFIKDSFYDRVIGITIEDIMNSKTVLSMASGVEKANSILGALRTKVIDVFITDEQTAKAVLRINK